MVVTALGRQQDHGFGASQDHTVKLWIFFFFKKGGSLATTLFNKIILVVIYETIFSNNNFFFTLKAILPSMFYKYLCICYFSIVIKYHDLGNL